MEGSLGDLDGCLTGELAEIPYEELGAACRLFGNGVRLLGVWDRMLGDQQVVAGKGRYSEVAAAADQFPGDLAQAG